MLGQLASAPAQRVPDFSTLGSYARGGMVSRILSEIVMSLIILCCIASGLLVSVPVIDTKRKIFG